MDLALSDEWDATYDSISQAAVAGANRSRPPLPMMSTTTKPIVTPVSVRKRFDMSRRAESQRFAGLSRVAELPVSLELARTIEPCRVAWFLHGQLNEVLQPPLSF